MQGFVEVALERTYKRGIRCKKAFTYTPYQTLRVLVHRPVFRELQLVLQHPDVHIRMIIRPEWRLQQRC